MQEQVHLILWTLNSTEVCKHCITYRSCSFIYNKNLTAHDGAKLNCQIVNFTVRIQIYCPSLLEPSIEDFPTDTGAMEGESVFFKILVNGKPEPTITWFHNGDEISTNYAQDIQPDGSLSFPSTEMKHSGVYKMVATNSSGSAEQEVKLNVILEAEKTPDIEKKSMTIPAVPVGDFGDYVEENSSNDHRGFRDQFMVHK